VVIVKLKHIDARVRAGLGDTLDEILEADVERGAAELYEIDAGASYAITRVERDVDELVLCAYRGRDVEPFFRVLAARAEVLGLRSVRFHTRRRGLARLARAAGWNCELAELVYRIPLTGQGRELAKCH
jgi:hypothetical protein